MATDLGKMIKNIWGGSSSEGEGSEESDSGDSSPRESLREAAQSIEPPRVNFDPPSPPRHTEFHDPPGHDAIHNAANLEELTTRQERMNMPMAELQEIARKRYRNNSSKQIHYVTIREAIFKIEAFSIDYVDAVVEKLPKVVAGQKDIEKLNTSKVTVEYIKEPIDNNGLV